MEKRKVEFELDVNKLAAYVAVLAAFAGIAWWIISAHLTHNMVQASPPPHQLNSTEQLVKDLAKGQLQLQKEEELRKELWGEDYRKKISSVVDEYDSKND